MWMLAKSATDIFYNSTSSEQGMIRIYLTPQVNKAAKLSSPIHSKNSENFPEKSLLQRMRDFLSFNSHVTSRAKTSISARSDSYFCFCCVLEYPRCRGWSFNLTQTGVLNFWTTKVRDFGKYLTKRTRGGRESSCLPILPRVMLSKLRRRRNTFKRHPVRWLRSSSLLFSNKTIFLLSIWYSERNIIFILSECAGRQDLPKRNKSRKIVFSCSAPTTCTWNYSPLHLQNHFRYCFNDATILWT